MDPSKLSAGDWIAGLSGLALLVSLFFPWYEPASLSGWESLAAFDVLLALVAATAVLLPLVTATQRVPAVPIALAALVTLVALFGIVLVLIRVVDMPDVATSREWGLWLALASAIGIFAGACLALREERWPGRSDGIETMPAPRP